ncbi:serine/threonine-protein kinase [Rhodococcus chondri]|uniref:Uncharacterized protein n=1 Tax=Rhodococcus chondri TaxID=3065941 RepID=A0ABU7JWE8_9NOCA|nr:hypothetical protein [Rhodococcus sp. CC-R104]MEE2034102.1 hypothetical protein [Rhodococcus sp. CC-R104]
MTGADDVLRRWNPHGWMRLHEPAGSAVRVAGVTGSGRGRLIEQLGALGGIECGYDGPAAVVLMVFDASAVIGRTELGVLDEADRDAAEVVCALTGTDRYPDWRTVRDRDVELLHRHAPWLGRVIVLPVSAEAAARARTLGGDTGRVLLLESGIVELRDVLATVVTGAHGPAFRAAVVTRTRRMITDEIAALRAEDTTEPLRAERARLAARPVVRDTGAPRRDVQRVRAELLQSVAAGVRAASGAIRDVLDDGTSDAREVASVLDGHVRELRGRVTAQAAALLGITVTGPPEPVPLREPPRPARSLEDRLAIVLGASAGMGLGRLLTAPFAEVGVVEAVSVPVTIACGIAVGWWLMRLRRRLAQRDRMHRWVSEELAEVRADLEGWVRTQVFDAEARLGSTSAAVDETRMAELRERVAEIDSRIRQRLGERNARLAACERDLAALEPSGEPSGRVSRPTG